MTDDRATYRPSALARVNFGTDATLVFTRVLAHPIDRVWAALTEPGQLSQWAPFTSDRDLSASPAATLTMSSAPANEDDPGDDRHAGLALPAEVTAVQPPVLLEYTWGDDLLRWELASVPEGTELTLRHTLSNPGMSSAVCAGWHICFDVADGLLAGHPFGPIVGMAARDHGWNELNNAYAERLGVAASEV